MIGNENDQEEIARWELKAEQLRKQLDVVRSELKKDPEFIELNFIDGILKKFTSSVVETFDFINKEFEIKKTKVIGTSKSEQHIQFEFVDGRKILFDSLPMGYKRIFSIVFDIAYRGFILNRGIEPTGIVIIDEIELHLHPTLQQEILQRFQKTFPGIQFIVTTHSPLVISNFRADDANKIIKLEHDGNNYWNENVENVFGIDYSTGLSEVMGASYRASTIDNLIDSIVILSARDRSEDAEKIKHELYAIVGENNIQIKKEIENRIEMNKI